MRADGSIFPIEIVIVRGERDGGVDLPRLPARPLASAAPPSGRWPSARRSSAPSPRACRSGSSSARSTPACRSTSTRRRGGTSASGRTSSSSTLLRGLGEARAARRRCCASSLERGVAGAIEADLVMPSGRRMKALVSATRIAYGGREAMLAATVDITELRETEAALRESQARLPRLHGLRPGRGAPARRRRALPDVQPADGGADRRAGGRGARADAERDPARPTSSATATCITARWSRPARCT